LVRKTQQEKLLLAEQHAERLQKLLDEQKLQLDKIAQREENVSERERALKERLRGAPGQDPISSPYWLSGSEAALTGNLQGQNL
jgi:hypothetical protein